MVEPVEGDDLLKRRLPADHEGGAWSTWSRAVGPRRTLAELRTGGSRRDRGGDEKLGEMQPWEERKRWATQRGEEGIWLFSQGILVAFAGKNNITVGTFWVLEVPGSEVKLLDLWSGALQNKENALPDHLRSMTLTKTRKFIARKEQHVQYD